MMIINKYKTGISAMIMLVLSASLALGSEWALYKNARFGTGIEVPNGNFIASLPPANGDGREWMSYDGSGQILVYGAFIVTVDTFKQYRKEILGYAADDGVDITYSVAKNGWFAYSGYLGRDIVYEKVVLTRGCSSLIVNHMYLRYPINKKAAYNPIVKRMAKTLRGSHDGAEC